MSASEHAHFDSELDLKDLVQQLRDNVDVSDRRYRLRVYKKCFVGSEACEWMVESGIASDFEQAVLIGNVMMQEGVFYHVVREHDFKNDYLFYRFTSDEDHGRHMRKGDGSPVSWGDFMRAGWDYSSESESLQTKLFERSDSEIEQMTPLVNPPGVEPLDEHNAQLLDHVHPRAWQDPEPKSDYNMVVIGAGTGGLVTAAAAAGLGARVALIEAHLMGGDCLNVGCVPSKALLSCAKVAHQVRRAADEYGVRIEGIAAGDLANKVSVDFPAIMARLRQRRAAIAHIDSAERFSRDLGVDVFIGRGTFTSKNTVEVNGKTLTFAKACIATGASPTLPPIEGIQDVPVLTNATLFNLTELPPRLGVIGGGPIGVEMAQAFQRFGSQVTLFERSERLMRREDEDAAAIVQRALVRDGVTLLLNTTVDRVTHTPAAEGTSFPEITLNVGDDTVVVDALLVATGRRPNVNNLGLEAAGVEFDNRGVKVNDKLQTTNGSIFAVGDVVGSYQFTHAADFMARLVLRNALFFGRDKFSNLLIPWATYSDPEVAHVGLYPRDIEERGIKYKTFTRSFEEVDRALLEGSTEGFVRIHVKHGTDEILGATIVGEHAGDLISEVTLAMQSKTGLGALASVIHPYPTRAEAIRQVGDMFNRTRLTLTVKKLFRRLMAVQR